MIKFKNDKDRLYYEFMGYNENVIRNRLNLISNNVKNRKKSLSMKHRWRKDKYKLKKAIQKWHNSVAGKRFHRNLGNFLATHLTFKDLFGFSNKKNNKDENINKIDISYNDVVNILTGLNSIKTHLILELGYFEKDFESLQEFLEVFYDYIEDAYTIEKSLLDALLSGKIDKDIIEEIGDIFLFFIDEKYIAYSFRKLNGLKNDMNIDESVIDDLKVYDGDKLKYLRYFYEKYATGE